VSNRTIDEHGLTDPAATQDLGRLVEGEGRKDKRSRSGRAAAVFNRGALLVRRVRREVARIE